jgi:hypothetical protein
MTEADFVIKLSHWQAQFSASALRVEPGRSRQHFLFVDHHPASRRSSRYFLLLLLHFF